MLSQTDFVIALMREEGLLKPEVLERATKHAAEHHVSVAEATVALGVVTARELAVLRAAVSECPFVDLDHYDIDLKNSALLPRSVADKAGAFPLFNLGRIVVVAMEDPLDLTGVDRIRTVLKADVEPVLCEPHALRALIERAYSLTGNLSGREEAGAFDRGSALEGGAAEDEPIVAAVNQIIMQALEQGASDVHVGPDERELHLRYRIDGALQVRQGPPLASHPGLVQRMKVLANMDLTQTRRPQDGKFKFSHGGRAVDIRMSVLPTVHGENVVLRLLASGAALGRFEDLGFSGEMSARLEGLIREPHGMILVTGPTGSGKTTTLYTVLKRLNSAERNIVTIEDPVEIRLPLVRQVQVNPEVGMTFAGALRSILRQDPDVILVGEIRDEETARIALQSALTGHLVLSTLHTNDAPGAVARLKDFRCPGFAINAALLCVLAQRLVRRVCGECATACDPDAGALRRFSGRLPAGRYMRGAGCARCMNSGYRGRVGVYELLRMTPAMQEAVEGGAPTAQIRATALREGMTPLWRDGLEKAAAGATTLDEVMRIAAASLEPDAESMQVAGEIGRRAA
jgi:type IV pilus assembly protein PilB